MWECLQVCITSNAKGAMFSALINPLTYPYQLSYHPTSNQIFQIFHIWLDVGWKDRGKGGEKIMLAYQKSIFCILVRISVVGEQFFLAHFCTGSVIHCKFMFAYLLVLCCFLVLFQQLSVPVGHLCYSLSMACPVCCNIMCLVVLCYLVTVTA
jgi:hypothetical protein